jgi:EAL domain-containing protein (putative c-di-GMP-specific phosphodiesterase class I)
MRCDEMQGYLFSKALAPADLISLLRNVKNPPA